MLKPAAIHFLFYLLISLTLVGCIPGSFPVPTPDLLQPFSTITSPVTPLTGTVVWEDGRCCAGGIAGETIQIEAQFSAASPYGDVNQMRLRTGGVCFSERELEAASWQPFVTSRSFPFTLPINWVGYFISVQYRDQQENLSPVYCDDISLEGMPPRTP